MNRAMTPEEIENNFGEIDYTDLAGGWVEIINDFSKNNMVLEYLPTQSKKKYLHKSILPAIKKSLSVIERASMFKHEYEYITELQIFAPRHIRNNIRKPLSSHSYGIAFDINPFENIPNCSNPKIPICIVNEFKKVGFFWGGDWKSYKDYMHFEPAFDFFDYKEEWK